MCPSTWILGIGRTKFSGHKGYKNAKNVIRANGPRRSMCPSTWILGIGRTKFHGLLNSLNVTCVYISFSFTVSYDLATLRSCFLFGSRMSLGRPFPKLGPFFYRMTPNVSEFLSAIGVSGPLTSSMIATARCFSHPNFKIQVTLVFLETLALEARFNRCSVV